MPVLLDRSFFRVSGSFRAWDRKVNMWLGVRPDVRGLPGAITPLPPVRSRKWLVPPALILADWSNRVLQRRHQRAHARNREGARHAQSLVAPGLACSVVRPDRPRRDGGRGRNRPEFAGTCAQHSASGCRGTQSTCRRGGRRAATIAATFEHPQYPDGHNGRKCGDQIAQMSDRRELLTSIGCSRPQVEIALRLQFGARSAWP